MSQSPTGSIRILHVDGEPDFADLAATYLEREDDRFTVETASDASDGVEHLVDGDFDCVVSGYEVPGRNGIEFLKAVREDYPDLPFILFTGRGSEEIAAEAIEAGVNSYQRKKSGTDQYVTLANRIRNHVEQHRQRTWKESKLRRQRTLIQGVLNAIPDVVFAYDDDDNHIVEDALLDEFADYPKAELAEMELLDFVPEENRAAVREHVQQALEDDETVTFETEIVTKAGKPIPHEYRAAPMELDGEVLGVAAAARDITERKEREAELEAKNNRLESFASMLAHELRNPVTIGQIYSQQLPADADSEAVDNVADAFDCIDDMIDVMLVLTRGNGPVGECTTVDLAAVAWEAWEDVDAPDATLDVAIDSTIEAHETYMRHLFRNLFENAVEHGRRDITVTVGELLSGFYVADDGPGIAAEEYSTVFETGYTTAADGGGTGLGLAFVHELTEGYDWACTVTESDAGGARFEFRNVDESAEVTDQSAGGREQQRDAF